MGLFYETLKIRYLFFWIRLVVLQQIWQKTGSNMRVMWSTILELNKIHNVTNGGYDVHEK